MELEKIDYMEVWNKMMCMHDKIIRSKDVCVCSICDEEFVLEGGIEWMIMK